MVKACKNEQKMDGSQIYPDFFKVFLPQVSSEKMIIPAAFIACLDKKLPGEIILKNRVGSLWKVNVVYTRNDGVFFLDGWENFVKDNTLVFGNFLVFRYNGACTVHFRIYGKCGYEKEDARASLSIGKRLSSFKEEEKERKEQDCNDDDNCNNNDWGHKEDEEKPKPRANYRKMVGGSAKPCGRGRKKKAAGVDQQGRKVHVAVKTEPNIEKQLVEVTERAMIAPRMHIPANASFTVILKTYHIINNFMLVPVRFSRICQLQVTKFIKLRVSNGKEWRVRYLCTVGKARISKGWPAFVRENDLKVGDICVFNLIQSVLLLLIRREMGESHIYPEFFKVFIPQSSSHRLYVPTDVIKDFTIQLRQEMILRDQFGRKWPGKVVVWKDGRSWIGGWNTFCKWNKVTKQDICIVRVQTRQGL